MIVSYKFLSIILVQKVCRGLLSAVLKDDHIGTSLQMTEQKYLPLTSNDRSRPVTTFFSYLIIVCALSGPTDTILIGTSNSSSRKLRNALNSSGNSSSD